VPSETIARNQESALQITLESINSIGSHEITCSYKQMQGNPNLFLENEAQLSTIID
jgi:hypothetical protein